MVLALEAMLGVAALVMMVVAPPLHTWIRDNLRENPEVANILRVVVAVCIAVPAAGFLVAHFHRMAAENEWSAEQVTAVAVAVDLVWVTLSLLLPLRQLALRQWDRKGREMFRLYVGVFLFSYLLLLGWWVYEQPLGSPTFQGHVRWGLPAVAAIMFGLEYLLLRLGSRLYPSDTPEVADSDGASRGGTA